MSAKRPARGPKPDERDPLDELLEDKDLALRAQLYVDRVAAFAGEDTRAALGGELAEIMAAAFLLGKAAGVKELVAYLEATAKEQPG